MAEQSISTNIAPFAGSEISVFDSSGMTFFTITSDSFVLLKFEHTSMMLSNLVRPPNKHPRRNALHPMPRGKRLGLGFNLLLEFMTMGWRKSGRQIGGVVTVRLDRRKEQGEGGGTTKEQDKGKDVVPPSQVTPVQSPRMEDDQLEEPPSSKRQNYDHYHEVGGRANFCKGDCRLLNDGITLDHGWATFAAAHKIKIGFMVTFKLFTPDMLKVIVFNDDGVHQIKIGFMMTFKLLSPDMLKVIVFNDNGIEVMTRCQKQNDAFAVNP
ncbi:cohesin subunit sa-1 [Hordeum vulgare]|nr:cohesin subunit sa-1 [Hordeum vulgare]